MTSIFKNQFIEKKKKIEKKKIKLERKKSPVS